jgi:hypothetical protein
MTRAAFAARTGNQQHCASISPRLWTLLSAPVMRESGVATSGGLVMERSKQALCLGDVLPYGARLAGRFSRAGGSKLSTSSWIRRASFSTNLLYCSRTLISWRSAASEFLH